MRRPRRRNPIAIALWANAVLLFAILIAVITRGRGSMLASPALAADQQPPIAGGAGVFVMPGQLAPNVWGCYLIDVDRQTLMVYEYMLGTHQLKLCAARGFRYDRDVTNFGTIPPPDEVQKWVEQEKNANRQAPPNGAQP